MGFTLEKKTVLLLVVLGLVAAYVLSKISVDVERKKEELLSRHFAFVGGKGNGA